MGNKATEFKVGDVVELTHVGADMLMYYTKGAKARLIREDQANGGWWASFAGLDNPPNSFQDHSSCIIDGWYIGESNEFVTFEKVADS